MSMCFGNIRVSSASSKNEVLRYSAPPLMAGKITEQTASQRRFKQHRTGARGDFARTQASRSTTRRVCAYLANVRELIGVAHRGVPMIAFHIFAFLRNRYHTDRVARVGVSIHKAITRGGDKVSLMCGHARAVGIFGWFCTRQTLLARLPASKRLRRPCSIPRVKQV